jgi:hypothetical protein
MEFKKNVRCISGSTASIWNIYFGQIFTKRKETFFDQKWTGFKQLNRKIENKI